MTDSTAKRLADTELVVEADGTLRYNQFVGNGIMVNRDFLDPDHPLQTYNFLKTHGIEPSDYGISHPLAPMYKELQTWTRTPAD